MAMHPDVKLLCEFNGADAAQATVDNSGNGHTFNFVGTCQLDTAQKRWGASSLYGDGNSDRIEVSADNAFSFFGDNTQDQTIDFWIRFTSFLSYDYIMSSTFQNLAVDRFYWMWNQNDGGGGAGTGTGIVFKTINPPNIEIGKDGNTMINDNNWHHLAICKVCSAGPTTEYGMYLDGTQTFYLSDNTEMTFTAAPQLFILGDNHPSVGKFCNAHIDEFRYSSANLLNAAPVVGKTDKIMVPSREYTRGSNQFVST